MGFLGLVTVANLVLSGQVAADRASLAFPLMGLVLAFAIAESSVVHLPFRKQAHSFSMSEVPLALGLFVASPTELVLARLLGSAIALLVARRQAPIKVAFNLATFAAATSVVVAVFSVAHPATASGSLGELLLALSAVLLGSIVETAAVSWVIRLSGDRVERDALTVTTLFSQFTALANASLGLILLSLMTDGRAHTMPLAIAPGLMLLVGYRAFTAEKERSQRLQLLYDTTRSIHSRHGLQGMAAELLPKLMQQFRGEVAEMVLWSDDGAIVMTGDGAVAVAGRQDGLRHGDLQLRQAMDLYGAVLHPAGETSPLAEFARARNLKDAIAAPLRGEAGQLGVILIAQRAGAVDTFTNGEVAILESIATAVASIIERDSLGTSMGHVVELREELAKAKETDPLTGLPTRATLLAERNRQRRGVTAMVAIELEGLDDVRAAMGPETADALLRRVAVRLGGMVRADDMVARLSGDRLAVLIRANNDVDVVHGLVSMISTSVAKPHEVDGRTLVISARIGLAVDADGSLDGHALLGRAVAALTSNTERNGARYVTFRDEMASTAGRRLAVRSALQQTVSTGVGLHARYQPIIDLGRGTVAGVEALARWTDQDLGEIPPSEFLPVAESLGLMAELGRLLVRRAIEDAAIWRDSGAPIGLTLNLSTAQLTDPHLVPDLEDLLRLHDIAPGWLTIDVNTSALAQHIVTVKEPLERLAHSGVHVALDDFRMGGTTDALLASLPIDTIKVPSEMLRGMGSEVSEEFVEALLEMGRRLDVGLIVEGVEAVDQLHALRRRGGGRAQGYLVAPPMTAESVASLLRALALSDTPERRGIAELIHLEARIAR